jgi:hypothetical protein
MGVSYNPRIVTDGLVFCVDAANPRSYPGAGTTWTDLTANKNNGTLTNGPTFDSANGGSILFDGSDDSVRSSDFDLDYISIFAWFKPTNFSQYREIASKWSDTGNGTSYSLLTDITTGSIRWWVKSGTATVNNNGQLVADEWNNVCATYDGVNSKTYHNGAFVAQVAKTGPLDNVDSVVCIGNRDGGNSYPMLGNIALVQIYNRALTSNEIRQNYKATKGRFEV